MVTWCVSRFDMVSRWSERKESLRMCVLVGIPGGPNLQLAESAVDTSGIRDQGFGDRGDDMIPYSTILQSPA
jgi:hypothetical protein